MPDPKRVYTDEEVRSILGRAVERQRLTSPEGLSHEDLLAVAHEAGIAPEAIEAAAVEVTARAETEDDVRAVLKERRSDFRIHLFTYIPILVSLAVVNLLTTAYPWVVWPALGWGLALALHARFALYPTDVEIANEAKTRADRRRAKAEKERRKAAKNELKEGARELGHAVERGVAVLLSETAKRIHEGIDEGTQKPPPRVRVERRARIEGDAEERDPEESESERRERH